MVHETYRILNVTFQLDSSKTKAPIITLKFSYHNLIIYQQYITSALSLSRDCSVKLSRMALAFCVILSSDPELALLDVSEFCDPPNLVAS